MPLVRTNAFRIIPQTLTGISTKICSANDTDFGELVSSGNEKDNVYSPKLVRCNAFRIIPKINFMEIPINDPIFGQMLASPLFTQIVTPVSSPKANNFMQ